MSKRKVEWLPKNRILRRTVYGLWLATPALALTSCGPSDPRDQFHDCGWWQERTRETEEIALGENEPLPAHPACDPCPPAGQWAEILKGCESKAVPGKNAYRLVCAYDWCDPHDGRRPEGLQAAPPPEAGCLLGAFTAQVAWLEAASVPAFLRLADELTAHGAPELLVKAARRSAGDEVRHTRVMKEFAGRHGARMPEVELPPFEPRSLEALLTENAIEGCVRETYGALVAGWQARHAGNAELRRVMRPIARDELRHAELAWAVDAWGAGRLTPEERARLRQARGETLLALEREVDRQPPPEPLIREAGLPSREQALSLLPGLAELIAQA